MSLRAMAAELGVSPATMSAVERGLTPLTVARLESVAAILEVPVTELVAGGPSAPPPPPPEQPGSWRSFDGLDIDPVLGAATRLFVRQGYHATSVREIAAEAGLSVAGVYHHYPSKEHLLGSLLDLTLEEIGWRMEAARRSGRDVVESFALMVESLALFHAVRGDWAFVGASEMRAFGADERVRITALRDDIQHALDRQAELCRDAGEFTCADLRTGTRAIATLCTSLPSWFDPDGKLNAQQVARQYADYALRILEWRGVGGGDGRPSGPPGTHDL